MSRSKVYPLRTDAPCLLDKKLLIDCQAWWLLVTDVGLVFDRIFSDTDLVGRQRAGTATTSTPTTVAAITAPSSDSLSAQLFRAVLIL